MIIRSIEEMAKATSEVLETFLGEYCEVNGIKEEELKEKLIIEREPITGEIAVKELSTNNILFKSSIERSFDTEKYAAFVSFNLAVSKAYPKTLEMMRVKDEQCTGKDPKGVNII